jgi:hypothetical protein
MNSPRGERESVRAECALEIGPHRECDHICSRPVAVTREKRRVCSAVEIGDGGQNRDRPVAIDPVQSDSNASGWTTRSRIEHMR